MSGNNIVIDTSLIINLFNGLNGIEQLIKDRNLFVSIITEIEILSFPQLNPQDKKILKKFLSECYIIDIDTNIKDLTIDIRSKHKTKLPDAVIAATAIYFDIPLFTMGKGFEKINGLNAIIFNLS
ncbi:MAG: type II toxin-antitoxin system VapC family toxin [Sphingobacteriales bacterium]|nr:type II toxin-antitoxin system VapC family toxin [Sphingobacteriales bacterium]